MLTASLGISSSSFYAAFGTKAALFDEAVRTYALRYSAIYDRALEESTVAAMIERLLIDSVSEFTRTDEGHPGCLTSSAVMSDTSSTLDVRAYAAELQRRDHARLLARLERASNDGELPNSVQPATLAELAHTLWQGLSTRAELGTSREALMGAAELGLTCIVSTIKATTPSGIGERQ